MIDYAAEDVKGYFVERARKAAESAYCPYSGFRVGAIVVAEGAIYRGANIENASYGLTLCAERVALAAAIVDNASIDAIAISCPDAAEDMGLAGRMPCGACRQWMAELCPDVVIYIDGIEGLFCLDDLLPNAFRLEGESDE